MQITSIQKLPLFKNASGKICMRLLKLTNVLRHSVRKVYACTILRSQKAALSYKQFILPKVFECA